MISFAITVSKEITEIKGLLSFLFKNINKEDEIVILFDEKNGSKDVELYLKDIKEHERLNIQSDSSFNYNFAEWKNKLNTFCNGEYIFQIDADEMISEYLIKNIGEIISLNKEVDLIFLPRINVVNGITNEHIKKWGWAINENGWINFPDFQGRVFKNGLKWEGKVHERITGFKFYSQLPIDNEQFCIKHIKNINRQEEQNNLYSKI